MPAVIQPPAADRTNTNNDEHKSYAEVAAEDPPSEPKSYAEALEQPPPENNSVDGSYVNLNGSKHGNGDSHDLNNGTKEEQNVNSGDSKNGDSDRSEEDSIILEKYKDSNGGSLISVQTTVENGSKESGPTQDKLKRQKTELVSGRQAGSGWSSSRIRFAPLNVPLQRRLQTFMVLAHTLTMVGMFGFFFWLCSIPLLWPILLPYLVFVLFSNAATNGELAHRNDRLRHSKLWSLYASYFPARLHRSEELPPTRKYVFGYHPHGIISHGAFAAFATEALGFGQLFPGITNSLLTLDSNFRIPLYRDYAMRMGLQSVSRESIENILSKGGPNGEGMGRAVTIVVGGARESLDARPYEIKLVLGRRKGFVKLAIRNGADLVPVLGFGENDIYEQFDAKKHPTIHKMQLFIKKIAGFTIPLFHARGVFNYDVGLMPYRRPINIVVGRPIKVMTQAHPEQDYIDEVHRQYVEELERIWNDWKDTFAKERTSELEILQ